IYGLVSNPSPSWPSQRDEIEILSTTLTQSFPDFGLYLYKTSRIFLAIRCGSIGQRGNGGHAHNDQLSFELNVDGLDFLIDPGTYLYSPIPSRRNEFRSTGMHNPLRKMGAEQNPWLEGKAG